MVMTTSAQSIYIHSAGRKPCVTAIVRWWRNGQEQPGLCGPPCRHGITAATHDFPKDLAAIIDDAMNTHKWRPGMAAPFAGTYREVGERGGRQGRTVRLAAGSRFPPTTTGAFFAFESVESKATDVRSVSQ